MPADFPVAPFERVYARLRPRAATHAAQYEHFSGAWNAISFRYWALCAYGEDFTASIDEAGAADNHDQRYRQERHLFGFFSNGFSTFEAFFYGMFAIGAILQPASFPLATPKDQQAVSPSSTERAFTTAFRGDPLLASFQAIFSDAAYREWKEIRNVLTHRTAPGRRIFVSIESDEVLPARWKINDIPLDRNTAATRRAHAARLLGVVLEAAATFVEVRVR